MDQIIQELTNAHTNLMSVSVKGQDTVSMAEGLTSLTRAINALILINQQKDAEEENDASEVAIE